MLMIRHAADADMPLFRCRFRCHFIAARSAIAAIAAYYAVSPLAAIFADAFRCHAYYYAICLFF